MCPSHCISFPIMSESLPFDVHVVQSPDNFQKGYTQRGETRGDGTSQYISTGIGKKGPLKYKKGQISLDF